MAPGGQGLALAELHLRRVIPADQRRGDGQKGDQHQDERANTTDGKASIMAFPKPGTLKACSTTTVPLSNSPKRTPESVIIGSEALRSACLSTTTASCSPLARAVRI